MKTNVKLLAKDKSLQKLFVLFSTEEQGLYLSVKHGQSLILVLYNW